MNVTCFLLVETGRQRLWLRRYRASESDRCPLPQGYHNALTAIGEEVASEGIVKAVPLDRYMDDPRWPAKCDCGYVFDVMDEFQVFSRRLWQRADGTPGDFTIEDAPPGAMWDAKWQGDHRKGPDGRCLTVKTPSGDEWCIDGRAANCDSPCAHCGRPYHEHNAARERCPQGYKDARPHKCWIRHGEPPVITVDKAGVTCGAGAGSIITGNWHGFLRNGVMVAC